MPSVTSRVARSQPAAAATFPPAPPASARKAQSQTREPRQSSPRLVSNQDTSRRGGAHSLGGIQSALGRRPVWLHVDGHLSNVSGVCQYARAGQAPLAIDKCDGDTVTPA